MSQKQYLYIEPFVYISFNKSSLLLLNTLTKKCAIFKDNSIVDFITKMISSNQYIQQLNWIKYNKNKEWTNFIDWLKKSFSGDLLNIYGIPPVAIKPNLDDFDIKDIEFGKIINLEIYLPSDCKHQCYNCGKYNAQFLFCKKSSAQKEIDIETIFDYIKTISIDRISSISLVGGDIWEYITNQDFIKKLVSLNCEIIFYINIRNLINKDLSLIHISTCKLRILIDEYFDSNIINNFESKIKRIKVDYTYNIVIKNPQSITTYNIENSSFLPFYDGNDSFFTDYVFFSKSDILDSDLSMREIYNKTHINTYFTGQLIINSDGYIYASFVQKELGNIKENNIQDILRKLFDKKSLWRLLRKDVPVCKDCLYKNICPSISNYELVMKRFNLCNIHY